MITASPPLVLASASAIRAALLRAAGVPIIVDAAAIDEAEAKASLRTAGAGAAATAEALAELKAQRISRRHAGALVLGADQVLECNGILFDKPADPAGARRQLLALRGRQHRLVSAIVLTRDGRRLWHHLGRASLTMRDFSETFLDEYLRAAASAPSSVGGYQLEGLGAQLFADIDGDYFTILGLPLLPVLDILREHGVLRS
ncbi:MAG: Maf family protein [Dongiaceae bacterium]